MPTEAQIEAAVSAYETIFGQMAIWSREQRASAMRAALTAAEEVRGQVSEADADLLDLYSDTLAAAGGADEALITCPQGDLRHLLALARRGAGQAVPDEAAIRAYEREQCAKIADAYETKGDDKFDDCINRSRRGDKNLELAAATCAGMSHQSRRIAAAIRSAAPKPEDKP